MRGKRERPNTSTGEWPSYADRSSSHRLRGAREVVHAQHHVALVGADVGEDPRCWTASAARRSPRPNTGCSLRSEMKRRSQRSSDVRRAHLGLDVDRLEAVHRVHQRRRVELGEVGPR